MQMVLWFAVLAQLPVMCGLDISSQKKWYFLCLVPPDRFPLLTPRVFVSSSLKPCELLAALTSLWQGVL